MASPYVVECFPRSPGGLLPYTSQIVILGAPPEPQHPSPQLARERSSYDTAAAAEITCISLDLNSSIQSSHVIKVIHFVVLKVHRLRVQKDYPLFLFT